MDGEAIATAFAITPGPDCIRDVVPKVGVRMKVYQAIKRALEVRSIVKKNVLGLCLNPLGGTGGGNCMQDLIPFIIT